MISYELAKKLKESGFSQDWGLFTFFYITKDGYLDKLWAEPWAIIQQKYGGYNDSLVKCPTLGELIAECGEIQYGFELHRDVDREDEDAPVWIASGVVGIERFEFIRGTTDEAVANLYLKLHD